MKKEENRHKKNREVNFGKLLNQTHQELGQKDCKNIRGGKKNRKAKGRN